MKSIGVIPTRYESSRFPGKPLVDIAGKTMIQRVYEQCKKVDQLQELVVATDDQRIYDHVQSFSGKVMMTDKNHPNGTKRIGEVIRHYEDYDLVINIQGDEPFINPKQIDALISEMKVSNKDIGTVAKKIDQEESLFDPNTVKVIFDKNGKAIYFSRHPIPFQRGTEQSNWLIEHTYYKHIGLYAFRRKPLLNLLDLPIAPLAKSESLEQLTWLENGYDIAISISEYESFGIDSPEDLEKALLNFNL